MRLVTLTANPDLPSYDPQAAALHILTALQRGDVADLAGLTEVYRKAPAALRAAVDARADIGAALTKAAEAGDTQAAFALGTLKKDGAGTQAALADALKWFERAAGVSKGSVRSTQKTRAHSWGSAVRQADLLNVNGTAAQGRRCWV